MILQLMKLSDLSIEFAQHLRRKALAADTPQAKAQLAAAFLKVTQDLRRTIWLERRLIREGGELARARRPSPAHRQDDEVAVPPDVLKH